MTAPKNYNANFPLLNTSFADWQIGFQNNFTQLYEAFNINHVSLDSASNAGNHEVVELVEQEKDIQTNASSVSIYAKDVDNQTDQLFIRFGGDQTSYQLTNYQIYSLPDIKNGSTLVQKQYFTFLPGGLIAYFGKFYIPKGSNPISLLINPVIAKNIITANLTPLDVYSTKGTPTLFNYQSPVVDGFAITAFTLTNGLTGLDAIVSVTATGNTFNVGDAVYLRNITGPPIANNLMYGKVTVAGTTLTIQSLNSAGSAFVNGVPTGGDLVSLTSTSGPVFCDRLILTAQPDQSSAQNFFYFVLGNT